MAGQKQQIIGSSECWHQVLQQVSQVAPLNRPILIIGERGTGKELIAERLHYLSMRWQQPYLQVNCAAMQENLLESELFGHEAGAFTGATRSRAGLFERADGGTLFLDELATASLAVQEKLLRIIEYGRFERVGAVRHYWLMSGLWLPAMKICHHWWRKAGSGGIYSIGWPLMC